MKIGLITDTHYNFKKANKYFHDQFSKFYDEIFFPSLKKNKIKEVIHLGDAFDNRKGVDYWALDWAKRNVYDKFRDNGITVYSIVGNHDIYYKNSNKVNSIELLLNEYDNIVPISSPKEVLIGDSEVLLLPWICPDNEKETFEVIKNTSAKLAFGHLELSGFCVYPGQYQQEGMDKKVFDKFEMVFSGHYHTRSNDGKIFYLGNPYQMFWNDLGDSRGFHLFDLETHKLKFIENTFNVFERVYYNEEEDYLQNDYSYLENKIVKIVVTNKKNNDLFENYLGNILDMNPEEVKIIETVDLDDTQVDYENFHSEDTLSILDKYIEESQFNLDKNEVKTILKNVYKEALELE